MTLLKSQQQIKHITILGGGLTGLTTAYRLAQVLKRRSDIIPKNVNAFGRLSPDARITLVEKSNRLGGWVHSRRRMIDIPNDAAGPIKEIAGQSMEVILERGPRSIRPKGGKAAAMMLKLLQDVGLSKAIIPVSLDHPSAKNRFILDLRSYQLVKLPSSIKDALTLWLKREGRGEGILKGFISSILKEPFRSRRSARTSTSSENPARAVLRTQINDTSVDNIIRHTFGPRIADALISSMVHGIYAADSRLVSVRAAFPVMWNALNSRGSLLWGLLSPGRKNAQLIEIERVEAEAWDALGEMGTQRKAWSIYGIKGGIETLTQELEKAIKVMGVDVRIDQAINHVDLTKEGCKLVMNDKTEIDTSLVISTLSSRAVAGLIPSDTGLPHLKHNPATTVGVVNMVFPIPPDKIHPSGFGYLVPRTADSVLFPPIDEQASPNPDGIIGVIFDSNSLSGVEESSLVETHLTKLTVMMGGPHWSSYPSHPADPASSPLQIPKEKDLAEKAMAHLSKVFPGIPQPVLTESTLQRECIPTYLVGHGQRMRELHNKLRTSDWSDRLILTGSSYGGVGVNDCVGMAEQTVADLVSSWTEDPPTKPPVTGLERWKDWD